MVDVDIHINEKVRMPLVGRYVKTPPYSLTSCYSFVA